MIIIKQKEESIIVDVVSSVSFAAVNDDFDYDMASRLIKILSIQKKDCEKYLVSAVVNINDGEIDEAKNNLILAKESFDDSEYSVAKAYVCGLLTQAYYFSEEEKTEEEIEELVKESFGYVRVSQYDKVYKLIGGYASILNKYDNDELAIEIIEEVLTYEQNLSTEAKFHFINKAKALYMDTNNYSRKCDAIIKSINYARELNDDLETAYTLVELAVEINHGKDKDYSLELIDAALAIDIVDEQDRIQLDAFIYLNLVEIYNDLGDFQKSQEAADKIKEDLDLYEEEYYDDVMVILLSNEIVIDIHNNQFDEAREKLDQAKALLENDKISYYIKKDIYIMKAEAQLNYALGDYSNAMKIYESILDISIEEDDIINQRFAAEGLYKISIDLVDIDLINKNYEILNSIIENQESKLYADSSYYISENVQKELLLEENEQEKQVNKKIIIIVSIVLLIISRIVVVNIRRLQESAAVDALTHIKNRKSFDKKYDNLIKYKRNFGAIMFDIDDFKNINDTYGHQFGDEVITKVSNAAKDILIETSEIYRYGGEEFVVIVEGTFSKERVVRLAEKMRMAVEKLPWEKDIKVTISLGVAFNNSKIDSVLEKADQNLYVAKGAGKNKVVFVEE